jgi:hypothetical protein
MSALGGLLELLHDAHERVRTLQAEYRDRAELPASSHPAVALDGDFIQRLRWRDGAPWPRLMQTRRCLWFTHPDRLRVELLHGDALVRVGVRDGTSWWRWDKEQGEASGQLGALCGLPPLLDLPLLTPARLLGQLRLTPTGAAKRAGRRVLCARATLRHPASPRNIAFELEFDAEHGTLLRRATLCDRRCLQLTEAVEVHYGGGIAADRFLPQTPAAHCHPRAHRG